MIQEYSSFLNLCGNLELINAEKEINLIKYPFSLCCNFDKNILNFILDNIHERENNEQIKLNYIIILKQIICSLYNTELLEEKIIKKIIQYLKTLILDKIYSKENKFLNKILEEIIEISKYMKNNEIIGFNEIKFALDKNFIDINIKSKLLLIDLLLKQNKMKHSKEFYEYLIDLEKNYFINIFKCDTFDMKNFYLYKTIMVNAAESLYKDIKCIKDSFLSLIPNLLENSHLLIELFIEKKII